MASNVLDPWHPINLSLTSQHMYGRANSAVCSFGWFLLVCGWLMLTQCCNRPLALKVGKVGSEKSEYALTFGENK